MAEKPVIAVFGISDTLGVAAANALTASDKFQVQLAATDISDKESTNLQNVGIKMIPCDLSSPQSVRSVLQGANGCFLLTQTDFTNPDCTEVEERQGCTVADACVALGVGHVVFCTEIHTQRVLGIQSQHMVAKAEIEDYLHSLCIPITCMMVPCRYEQFFSQLRPHKVTDNQFELVIPMGSTPLALMSEADLAAVLVDVFVNPQNFVSKTLSLCGDKLTVKEMAAILSRQLFPMKFKDKQVTLHEYQQQDLPWAVDWANMFHFFQRVDQRYNNELTRKLLPNVQTFETWVKANKVQLQKVFQE